MKTSVKSKFHVPRRRKLANNKLDAVFRKSVKIMDSVDDSIVTTPADTSNLSSPEWSSSDVSQPTVKLREISEPRYRKINYDGPKRRYSIDGHDPFLQTLDKDGCQLVETTGRTAQRARASIRDGSKINQKFNQPDLSESKVNECRWPKTNQQPRKCHSATGVGSRERNTNRRIKKRHSYGVESSRRSWNNSEIVELPKRYSTGDYLRQQILEDLNSNEIIGKTDEQIAEDRCNRVKAYLRRRNEDSSYVSPEARLRELRNCWRSEEKRDNNLGILGNPNRRKDLDRIRAYLQDKIRMKMDEEGWRNSEIARSSANYPNELSMQDIRRRYSDYYSSKNLDNCPTKRAYSDANIRREPVSSESGPDEKTFASSVIRNRKAIGGKRNVCRRTRSDVIPEAIIDPDDNEVRKRFYSYSGGRRYSWKTKSGLTFEKKLSLPIETWMNLERESDASSPSGRQNDSQFINNPNVQGNETVWNKNSRKYCRRTRSDLLPETLMQLRDSRREKRRSASCSDRRKLHRRTSIGFAGIADEISIDSKVDTKSSSHRTKFQQSNSLCSWREYKEKRRQDRLRKGLANIEGNVEFSKICTVPVAWSKNTQTLGDTVNAEDVKEKEKEFKEVEFVDDNLKKNDITTTRSTSPNENCIEYKKNVGDTADDTETETILQENYLLLEQSEVEEKESLRSPIISKLQVNQYRDTDDTLSYDFDTPDIGYDTIPKNRGVGGDRGGWIEFNVHSNVKKSDTFKIVDGSENATDDQCQKKIDMCNYDVSLTSWPANYCKSSSFGRAAIISSGDARVVNADTVVNLHSEGDDSQTSICDIDAANAAARSSKDIARDYFRRVYELLKHRQDDARRETPKDLAPMGHDGDTSSSNCDRLEELRKRRRRKKKDKTCQGKEISVAVENCVSTYFVVKLHSHITQNITERCQKHFLYFIAIKILSQHFCQMMQNILSQHYNFNFLKYC